MGVQDLLGQVAGPFPLEAKCCVRYLWFNF